MPITAYQILSELGWRVDTPIRKNQAVKDFQRGWNLGAPLVIDGLIGPKTEAALNASHIRFLNKLGTASRNFSFSEFACKCGGKYAACARIKIIRGHIQRLEAYRTKVNKPVNIVSGFRCFDHNKAVGGAKNSQHQYGGATDINALISFAGVRAYSLFAGIGYQQSTGKVVHVDSRDMTGMNVTHSSNTAPAVWRYSA